MRKNSLSENHADFIASIHLFPRFFIQTPTACLCLISLWCVDYKYKNKENKIIMWHICWVMQTPLCDAAVAKSTIYVAALFKIWYWSMRKSSLSENHADFIASVHLFPRFYIQLRPPFYVYFLSGRLTINTRTKRTRSLCDTFVELCKHRYVMQPWQNPPYM